MSVETILPTQEERAAIELVMDELGKYGGEEIVKDEPPLHDAVVKLESYCQPGRDQNKLFPPAKLMWFSLLWASRPNSPTYAVGDSNYNMIDRTCIDRISNPEVAKQWAACLVEVLKDWLRAFPLHRRRTIPHVS